MSPIYASTGIVRFELDKSFAVGQLDQISQITALCSPSEKTKNLNLNTTQIEPVQTSINIPYFQMMEMHRHSVA